MNDNTAIEKLRTEDVDVINALEWRDVVNDLVEQLDSNDIPEKVVRGVELMLSGLPNYKVAKELGVTVDTVKSWFTKYPIIAVLVKQGRQLLVKWRMARLEQQYIKAIEKSEEILNLSLFESEDDATVVNAKLAATQAQHSRFIIEQFTKQINDVAIQSDGEKVTMNASADALAYIAKELQNNRQKNEPIDVTYRVIDPSNDAHQPILDEQGNPIYGEMGKLDTNDDGTLCHVCGKRYKKLSLHLTTTHVLPNDVYEMTFMLPEGAVNDAD